MRQTVIFSGSSHPELVESICDRLAQQPGRAELKKFSNGETSVQIQTSVRDQDVFVVQSGSSKINDNIMELLIMISACKGGSSKSITAVMPYFPYSRQSKKKSHRGAITARMIANLLSVAGVNHVITIDLHASQMQGFFKCPVDNLVAEPLLARWIKHNVPDWREAVVVSKNPGGTKRVTTMADALKLSFGIVTTDRRRFRGLGNPSLDASMVLDKANGDNMSDLGDSMMSSTLSEATQKDGQTDSSPEQSRSQMRNRGASNAQAGRINGNNELPPSSLQRSAPETSAEANQASRSGLTRVQTAPSATHVPEEPTADDEYTDERARDVITGRLIHGHIVDDNFPSPTISAMSSSNANITADKNSDEDSAPDHMLSSFASVTSSVRNPRHPEHALGGTIDAGASSEEEEEDLKNPELETMVTLVGNVKDRPVFIVDDMIDKGGSWVAAAETVVKRGGAIKVYCIASHGLFAGDCLEEMDGCECIEKIVVTNSFPLPADKKAQTSKLEVLDVAPLLAEAIRRNHHGESISQLFSHYD